MPTAAFISARKALLAELLAAHVAWRDGVVNPAIVKLNAAKVTDPGLQPLADLLTPAVLKINLYRPELDRLIAETNAMVASDPPPPPPPPPPLPDGDANVVLVGGAILRYRHRNGPADRAKLSTLKAAVAATPKWTTFVDEFEHVAASQNGVRPTSYVKLHIYGNMNGLYRHVPILKDDGTMRQFYPRLLNDFAEIAKVMPSQEVRPGPRGRNVMTPYTTWHGHPRKRASDGVISMSPHIPMWVGIQMNGMITFAMRDGSVAELFKIPGVGNTTDFTFFRPNAKFIFAVDALKGNVIKIDRTPGIVTGSPEDFSKWVVSILAGGFKQPTSVREVGGVLYVADPVDNAIFTVGLDGTVTKLIDCPKAFFLDHNSEEKLVCCTQVMAVYQIDPAAPVLGLNLGVQSPYLRGFVTVSVDKVGTFGTRDAWIMIGDTGNGNTDMYQFDPSQATPLKWFPFVSGYGYATVGDTHNCIDVSGHYLWGAEHHPEEGALLVFGQSDVWPSLIVPKQAAHAPEDAYDSFAFGTGYNIIQNGAGLGVVIGAYPSFTCQMSNQGWSGIGCTPDLIAELPFDKQAEFVWQGMLGGFPRPLIKGRDLFALLYYINRSSQVFLKKGAAHMDALRAFCAPMLGQELPAIAQRDFNQNTDKIMSVVKVGGMLKLTCADYAENVVTPPDTLQAMLVIDEGFPEENSMLIEKPWEVPVPDFLTPGQHSARCVAPAGVADPGAWRGEATVVVV